MLVYENWKVVQEKNLVALFLAVDDKNIMFNEIVNSFRILKIIEGKCSFPDYKEFYYEIKDGLESTKSDAEFYNMLVWRKSINVIFKILKKENKLKISRQKNVIADKKTFNVQAFWDQISISKEIYK
jgi:hypothetical protein